VEVDMECKGFVGDDEDDGFGSNVALEEAAAADVDVVEEV